MLPSSGCEWSLHAVVCLVTVVHAVVRLLQTDEAQYPFSQTPPTFIRAGLYKYWFTEASKDG